MKRFAGIAVVLGLIGLAATALLLWWLPADDFLFVPDRAKPLADKVEVEGGRTNAKGDVYYVDLFVRRIRKLEQLLPFTRPDGSTFVSEDRLTPAGTSDAERDRQNAEDMKRSEQIAAVVALRALGYQVTATPRGVLVTAVYSDVPAGKVLDPNDVIVGVDGVPVRTPVELRREIARIDPGDDVSLSVRRDGKVMDVTVRTIPSPEDASRAVIGILVDQDATIELPLDVDIDLGRVGGPSAGFPFALEIARQLGRNVTHGCRIAATGALALDGSVIPIGGENAEIARKYAHGLRIIPVDSFQQALRRLTTSPVKC